MRRALAVELLHLAAGVVATVTIFAAADWSYPIGHTSFLWVGVATMAAVLAMSVKPLRKAWRAGQGARG